jgi:hypothetical protein
LRGGSEAEFFLLALAEGAATASVIPFVWHKFGIADNQECVQA